MPAHKHADLIAEYAKDARETDKPWERWEYSYGSIWSNLWCHPCWKEGHEYRRKPRTITINGYNVPEPERKILSKGQRFYLPRLMPEGFSFSNESWEGSAHQHWALSSGLVHLTAVAAATHAKALVSLTKVDN